MQFSTFDVVKILGIKRDKLRDLMDRGFIQPSYSEAFGDREKSIFDRWALYELKLFLSLVESGLSRKKAGDFIRTFHSASNRTDDNGRIKAVKGRQFLKPSKAENPLLANVLNKEAKDSHSPDLVVIIKKDGLIIARGDFADPYILKVNSEIDFDEIIIINFAKIRKQVDEAINNL